MVRILLFLFLFCSSVFQALSQDLEKTLAKTVKFYDKERYEMDIQHLLYSLDGEKLYEQQDIVILKDGDNYYASSYGIEKIKNSNYQVIVNHQTRLIFISSLKGQMSDEDKKQQREIQSDLRQLFSVMQDMSYDKQNNIQYLGIQGNNQVYHATFRDGVYEGADFYFDKETGQVKRSVYFTRDALEVQPGVREKAKLVILPKKFKTKGSIDKKRFSTDAIFRIGSDKQIVLTDQYKGYTPIVE